LSGISLTDVSTRRGSLIEEDSTWQYECTFVREALINT